MAALNKNKWNNVDDNFNILQNYLGHVHIIEILCCIYIGFLL